MKADRKKTKEISIGRIPIGNNHPIAIQSMWKNPLTQNIPGLCTELEALKRIGCDILRFAVPNSNQAEFLGNLSIHTELPLVADIHFDYKIAMRCLDFPISKIRINPGNIGAQWKIRELVQKAHDQKVPIRIGVNAGSLPRDLKNEKDTAMAMVKTAEREIEHFHKYDFRNIVVSLKSSDVDTTVRANEIFSEKHPYPLHIGLTESGPLVPGTIKSTIAITEILRRGIGDTIRVSLSEPLEREIYVANEILKVLELKKKGVSIISCPRCGRAKFDVHGFLSQVEEDLQKMDKNITIAVMGCEVNGPEEAKHADIGVTGSGKRVLLFKNGKIMRTVTPQNAIQAFYKELEKL